MSDPRRHLAAIALSLIVVASCSSEGGPTEVPSPASVTVSLTATTLVAGKTTSAVAVVKDAQGAVMDASLVSWSTSNAAIANVTAGQVTAVAAGTANIIASIGTISGSAAMTVTPRIPASVTISLAASTLVAGKTTTVTAVVKDVEGTVLDGSGVTFTSSNAAVATVAGGVVTAVGAGSANILATLGSLSASAPLTVTVTPLLAITFDNYASTAALVADCATFAGCVNDVLTGNGGVAGFAAGDVALDTLVAPPGAKKSMRYHYRHPGDGCNSISLGRDISITPQQEVWSEFKLMWSANFSTGNTTCPPNDHKVIFGLQNGALGGRWAFYVGSDSPPAHNIEQERPFPNGGGNYLNLNTSPRLLAETLWDGTWHVIRLHMRHSTTNSSADGVFEIWIDGVLKHQQKSFNTSKDGSEAFAPSLLRGFALGRNKDDGPPLVDMNLWWGPVTLFNTNPGW